MTPSELYAKFKAWNPEMDKMVLDYRQWGSNSLCIWLYNGMKYKAKLYDGNKFIMQTVTDEDVKRKFGGN